MTRLYRAWSLVGNFRGQDQVMFNWFVIGRSKPVAPYEELIDNYDESDEESGYDRLLVDEFFTADEIEELREYLFKTHEIEVQTEEVLLPVRAGGLSYELLLISGQKSFYTLADENEYDLSVAVLGHFDIEEKKINNSLSFEDLMNGTSFLQNVFKHLKISGFEQNDLIAVLNKINEETGYRVQKSTKPATIKN